jgi:hypothetical protein
MKTYSIMVNKVKYTGCVLLDNLVASTTATINIFETPDKRKISVAENHFPGRKRYISTRFLDKNEIFKDGRLFRDLTIK